MYCIYHRLTVTCSHSVLHACISVAMPVFVYHRETLLCSSRASLYGIAIKVRSRDRLCR